MGLSELVTRGSEEEPDAESNGDLDSWSMPWPNLKKEPKSVRKGLIHVKVGINGKNTRAIVNRGPTHNFISVEEAKTDGLKPNKERVCLCPLKALGKALQGLARAVELHMGDWKGKVDTLATMDDFQVWG